MTRLPEDDVGNVIQPGDRSAESAIGQMVNGTLLFTIQGGPIDLISLRSRCVTDNSSLATTLQYKFTPTSGTAQTISGATAALTSVTGGSVVDLNPVALTTAPAVTIAASGGVGLLTNNNLVRLNEGTITAVLGVSSLTGTWKHHARYRPLSPNAVVS